MFLANGDKLNGGKYTLERQLGQGRFCITYLVKDSRDERFVIKTLNYNSLGLQNQSEEEKERLENKFLNEAQKIERCRHSNIVKVEEIFKENGQYYLVMEYLAGYSLAERDQKVMAETDALPYIQQIASALRVVHKQGLIHRDVKPGNIIIRSRGGKSEAILIDFDLALDFESNITTQKTKEASAGYAPPELYSRTAQKDKVSPATDVYSLAATLYNLLTGEKPTDSIELKIDKVSIVPPQQLNSEISDRANKAILSGMRLEPGNRPQSIQAWLDLFELDSVAEEEPITNNTSTIEARKINWNANTIAAIGGLLAGIAAILALIPQFVEMFTPKATPSPTPAQTSMPKQE